MERLAGGPDVSSRRASVGEGRRGRHRARGVGGHRRGHRRHSSMEVAVSRLLEYVRPLMTEFYATAQQPRARRSCSRSRCQTGDGCSVAVVRASAWNRHRALRRGIASPCANMRHTSRRSTSASSGSVRDTRAVQRRSSTARRPPWRWSTRSRAGTAAVPHRQQYELCSAGLRPRAAHRGDGVPRQLNCLPPMSRAGTAAVPHRQQYELCSAGLLLIQPLSHL